MLRLSTLIFSGGLHYSPQVFSEYLRDLENRLYALGWTVIGSVHKLPNLHPWKLPSREQLHIWAQQDLAYRANSLNLRLADTNTIALDCDFNDGGLMGEFVDRLAHLLDMPKSQIFTCTGKKGAKLFFRFQKGTRNEVLPRKLGPTVYTAGCVGMKDFKQELEIKSDLSTIAGLYGPYDPVLGDTLVYGPYENFPYIGLAAPSDLRVITMQELHVLTQLYICLVKRGGYETSLQVLTETTIDHEFTRACALVFICQCLVRLQVSEGYENLTLPEALEAISFDPVCKSQYKEVFVPLFWYIGQDDACDLISNVLYDRPLTSPQLLKDAAYIKSLFTAEATVVDLAEVFRGACAVFRNGAEPFYQLLLTKASKLGINPSTIFDLYSQLCEQGQFPNHDYP